MNETLEALWYSYLNDERVPFDPERDRLVEKLQSKEEKLRASLSAEQIAAIEEYEGCRDSLGSLAERDAFFRGVRIATKFLFDALCEN